MITIENVDVTGFEAAIRGMRNPMNSWDKSDSKKVGVYINGEIYPDHSDAKVGENDLDLMKRLVKSGSDHRKFMRMINVTMDIKAPLYWWKEFDTYKVGTVANSCSTMHKIHDKEFMLDDFSHEHLVGPSISTLTGTINVLNCLRDAYNQYKDKKYWWNIIQLLPSSYNQLRTVQLNYEVLVNIYFARRDHKLDEWVYFCLEITKLPLMSEFLNVMEK